MVYYPLNLVPIISMNHEVKQPPVQYAANRFKMIHLYSDSSRVFYKPHSLASGGVGTVRNSRFKGRYT